MKSLIKVGTFIAFLTLFSPIFASEAPVNLKVLEASDSSISLDWDDVNGVIGYYIYYGTQSGSGGTYEVEGIDLIDKSEFVLEDLQAEKRYYIALTSVDEFGTESEYSNEIEYVTLQQGAQSQAASFRISNVQVIDQTTIELMFSTDLETGSSAVREFIIEDKNTGREIGVDISDVLDGKPRSVVVILGSELDPASEYQVTVLDISDAAGNTIESGIDAFINFTTPSEFTLDLESAGPEQEIQPLEENIIETSEEIATLEEVENTQAVEGNNAGTNININDNTLSAAQENEKLPQTGPEHWILAFIALLLTGGIYYTSFKKEN